MLLVSVYALDDPPVVSVPFVSFSHPAMPAITARALLLTVPGSWPSIHDTSGSMLSLLAAVVDHRYGLPATCGSPRKKKPARRLRRRCGPQCDDHRGLKP